MKRYIKNGKYAGSVILLNSRMVSNPTEKQLIEAGYKLVEIQNSEPTKENTIMQRMSEIEELLKSMDYLSSKYIDNEDMSEYGDWQEFRKKLRLEYRQLETLLDELNG